MTYQRVVNRNRLAGGSHETPGPDWHAYSATVYHDALSDDPEHLKGHIRHLEEAWREAADTHNARVKMLMGDLRRLEQDTVDERTTCEHIARRTNIDEETVAAVLREFLSW